MKKTLIITLILALTAAMGWWWRSYSHHSRQGNMVRFETDTTEGLLRGIMQECDADKPNFYFVVFGEERTDPSRLFIARFANHFPPVRVGSSAFMRRNGQLQATASGQTGVTIQILRLREIKAGTCEALVMFPKLPADRNRFKYRVVAEAGKWLVKFKWPA